MSRDPLTRMDVDTNWAYHRKVRTLQARYPQHWTTYWCAYQALLGEAWAKGNRKLTIEQTWCPALPCTPAEALSALIACEVVDKAGRVPLDSWREWVEPAMARMKKSSDAGQRAAHKRWHVGEFERCQLCADAMQGAMRPHSDGNAPRQPRQPSIEKNGRDREGARGRRGRSQPSRIGQKNGSNGLDDRAERIARAQSVIDSPDMPADVKRAARGELSRLGVTA